MSSMVSVISDLTNEGEYYVSILLSHGESMPENFMLY